jgi:glycerol uptake facilitator-like aquaporin
MDGMGDIWTDVFRPMVTQAAGAAVAQGIQSVSAQPVIKQQMTELAVQKSAEGLQKYINWMKDHPAKTALYGLGGIAGLMAAGIFGYKILKRK